MKAINSGRLLGFSQLLGRPRTGHNCQNSRFLGTTRNPENFSKPLYYMYETMEYDVVIFTFKLDKH
jgi:hypothetical protein